MNYWIFQTNPEVYNIIEALRREVVETVNVKAHKDDIKVGDQFILWVTGKSSGCYALGEVLTEVGAWEENKEELKYWLAENTDADKVKVKITYNVHNRPIHKDRLNDYRFKNFKGGSRGSTFSATKSEFEGLVELIELDDVVYEPTDQYAIHHPQVKPYPLNMILYGPPGTGKTFNTINYALAIIENRRLEEVALESEEHREQVKIRFDEYTNKGQIAFITFHQSMAYEDFIEGIKPKTEGKQVVYEIEDGLFKKVCKKAMAQPSQPYVLIIDEINRGNIAAIFGELITLIETNKRLENQEALAVQLPYSKQPFSIPANLHIIGTMNTADRSVEALDTALRRRFTFIEVPPQPNKLTHNVENISLSKLLENINQRIEKLLDKDHLIGHSYFINIHTLEELKDAFDNQIIPLLQEYFYGDWGKIGLVLGKHFIKKKKPTTGRHTFADFYYEGMENFDEVIRYETTAKESWDEVAFLEIIGNK